jgi:phage protein D
MPRGAVLLVDNSEATDLSPTQIQVIERVRGMTTYRLRFSLDIDGDGDLALLKDDRLSPGSKLGVVVPDGDAQALLVNGPVFGHQIHLDHGSGNAFVDVLGADVSLAMDRESHAKVWAGQLDSDAVSAIVSTGSYELTPDVEDTPTRHDEDTHALVQRATDWAFVQRLARRNGFFFWVTADPSTGDSTAHFKRPDLTAEPERTLVINQAQPNVTRLDVHWNIERPSSATAKQVSLNDKTTIDGDVERSPLPPLGTTALADIGSDVRKLHLDLPADDMADLAARGEAALIEAGFFIQADAVTTAERLQGVLRSHTIVQINGAGSRHSGKYFCASVVHDIDDTTHAMAAHLWRNAWND